MNTTLHTLLYTHCGTGCCSYAYCFCANLNATLHTHCSYTLLTLQAWADDYFKIPMRGEHRGVGGVFFDDLECIGTSTSPQQFVRDIALAFMPSYLPIATARGTDVRQQ
jgi:coproporphyrinogen III oxidase